MKLLLNKKIYTIIAYSIAALLAVAIFCYTQYPTFGEQITVIKHGKQVKVHTNNAYISTHDNIYIVHTTIKCPYITMPTQTIQPNQILSQQYQNKIQPCYNCFNGWKIFKCTQITKNLTTNVIQIIDKKVLAKAKQDVRREAGVRGFHKQLKDAGANVGTFEEFDKYIKGGYTNRHSLWKHLKDAGANVGTYDQFRDFLFTGKAGKKVIYKKPL